MENRHGSTDTSVSSSPAPSATIIPDDNDSHDEGSGTISNSETTVQDNAESGERNNNAETIIRPDVDRGDENIDDGDVTDDESTDFHKRHRNYTFSFPLANFLVKEEYYNDLWKTNCKYILFQKEGKYISHMIANFICLLCL